MKALFISFILMISIQSCIGQTNRCFSYDNAGNRVLRTPCEDLAIEDDEKNEKDSIEHFSDYFFYPNPAFDKISFSETKLMKYFGIKITIYNMEGRMVYSDENEYGDFDISQLSSGSYTMIAENGGPVKRFILIKFKE